MKKLMMAVAIVCAAVAAQAATIEWMQVTSEIMAADTGMVVADGSAVYLVLSTYGQTDFAAAYAAANGDMDATIASVGANILGSSVTDGGFIYDETTHTTGAVDAYYVVFADKMAYISDIVSADVDPLSSQGNSLIEFGLPTNSELAAVNASAYAGGAGWINVPEPTSGLMMLLGMGVLALRRRRA